jgi:hypothetical protein
VRCGKKTEEPTQEFSPLYPDLRVAVWRQTLDKVFVPRGQRARDVTFVTAAEVD